MTRFSLPLILSGLCLLPLSGVAQYWNDFELEPHSYRSRELQDPVSLFLEKVDSGGVTVDEPNGKPLVKRLLETFDIPVSSQVLVFTKTSLQRDQVSVENPRALYFNENVYLGWMPGGRIEIASIDQEVGPVFYFQRPLDRPDDLLFRRTRSCLGCHAGSATNFLPGLLGQSVFPRENGSSMGTIRTFERISHEIPYEQRWGGWMVSGGGLESLPHMANAIATRNNGKLQLDRKTQGTEASDLSVFFPEDAHLTKGSDILAMLAHDHQISAHYHINEAQFRVRQGLFDAQLDFNSGREALEKLKKSDRADVSKSIDKLLSYFLFANEPALPGNQITDHGSYRADFHKNKRTSKTGKSLKDLDLKDRLLTHRLSWMVYSKAFDGMPRAAREEFFFRLWNILKTQDAVEGYEHLGQEEKASIFEILTDTKADLPAFWKESGDLVKAG